MPINKVATDTMMMKNDIRELEELLEEVKTKMQTIKQEIGELNVMWDGSTKIGFNNQFEEDYAALEQVMVCVSGMIHNMKLAQIEYVKCEDSIGDIIKNVNI